jgi:hypothetical protein
MKRWDRFCEIRELSRPHFYEMSEVLVLTSTRSHSPTGRTRNEAGALTVRCASTLAVKYRSIAAQNGCGFGTISSICNLGETMPELAERGNISRAFALARGHSIASRV